MKTSNFAISGGDPHAISVARWAPKWYKGRHYPQLAPHKFMLKLTDPVEYRCHYAAILLGLDPEKIYRDLGKNAILLCWEKPGEFCHRRLIAEWLEERLGVTIEESSLKKKDMQKIVDANYKLVMEGK